MNGSESLHYWAGIWVMSHDLGTQIILWVVITSQKQIIFSLILAPFKGVMHHLRKQTKIQNNQCHIDDDVFLPFKRKLKVRKTNKRKKNHYKVFKASRNPPSIPQNEPTIQYKQEQITTPIIVFYYSALDFFYFFVQTPMCNCLKRLIIGINGKHTQKAWESVDFLYYTTHPFSFINSENTNKQHRWKNK